MFQTISHKDLLAFSGSSKANPVSVFYQFTPQIEAWLASLLLFIVRIKEHVNLA